MPPPPEAELPLRVLLVIASVEMARLKPVVDGAAASGRVAAKGAVGDRQCPSLKMPPPSLSRVRVAAKSAVGDRQRSRRSCRCRRRAGRVAADCAVGDRQRRAAHRKPSLKMPPPLPWSAELPLIVQLLTVRVA